MAVGRKERATVRNVALLVVAAGSVSPYAIASSGGKGDCVAVTQPFPHVSDGERTYRINATSFAQLDNFSVVDHGVHAVVMAAETWNHQANAGTFLRLANTSRTEPLPADKDGSQGCDAQGIDYSLVIVREYQGNLNRTAQIRPRCRNSQGNAEQFEIEIFARQTDDGAPGDFWPWSVGDVGSDELDLPGILTHEFGHAMNINHPAHGEFAVMDICFNADCEPLAPPPGYPGGGGGDIEGSTRQRDLYAYDLKCAEEISGHRTLSAYRRWQTSGGSLGGEWAFTGTSAVAQASAGATWHTGSQWTAAAFKRDTCTAWTRGLGVSNTSCTGIDDRVGIGPTEATWRENPSIDRVFYADWEETPMWAFNAKHRARYERSDDGFQSGVVGSMNYCATMNDWMSCSPFFQTPLYTGKQLAFAWDNWRNRTVAAWARQTRNDDAADRRVMIAIGHIEHWLLPEPDHLDVRTTIPPAVACDAFSAGNYDCIVAFTDQADPLNTLRIRRFWSGHCGDRYCLTPQSLDPDTYILSGRRTAAPVALWFNDGNFYLMYRQISPYQQLALYESSNGVSFSFVQFLNHSGIGSSAASYVQGADYVVYAR
jgi:hypothetical protein